MPKGRFMIYQGAFTDEEFNEVVDDTRAATVTKNRLRQFFVEGKEPKDIDAPSKQTLNNGIHWFLKVCGEIDS